MNNIVNICNKLINYEYEGTKPIVIVGPDFTLTTAKKNQDLLNYKIDELTEHVNKHNTLIDRMYKVENRVTLLEEKER